MNIRKNKKRVYRQFRHVLLMRDFHQRLARRACKLTIAAIEQRIVRALVNALYMQHRELIKAFCALETAVSGGTAGTAFGANGLLGNGLSAFGSHVRTTGGNE